MTHRRLSEASMGHIAKTLAIFSETPASPTPRQAASAKFLCLRFEVQGVKPGTAVALVGSSAMLGMWDLGHMVRLTPRFGSSIWTSGEIVIPVLAAHASLEYKYILVDSVSLYLDLCAHSRKQNPAPLRHLPLHSPPALDRH